MKGNDQKEEESQSQMDSWNSKIGLSEDPLNTFYDLVAENRMLEVDDACALFDYAFTLAGGGKDSDKNEQLIHFKRMLESSDQFDMKSTIVNHIQHELQQYDNEAQTKAQKKSSKAEEDRQYEFHKEVRARDHKEREQQLKTDLSDCDIKSRAFPLFYCRAHRGYTAKNSERTSPLLRQELSRVIDEMVSDSLSLVTIVLEGRDVTERMAQQLVNQIESNINDMNPPVMNGSHYHWKGPDADLYSFVGFVSRESNKMEIDWADFQKQMPALKVSFRCSGQPCVESKPKIAVHDKTTEASPKGKSHRCKSSGNEQAGVFFKSHPVSSSFSELKCKELIASLQDYYYSKKNIKEFRSNTVSLRCKRKFIERIIDYFKRRKDGDEVWLIEFIDELIRPRESLSLISEKIESVDTVNQLNRFKELVNNGQSIALCVANELLDKIQEMALGVSHPSLVLSQLEAKQPNLMKRCQAYYNRQSLVLDCQEEVNGGSSLSRLFRLEVAAWLFQEKKIEVEFYQLMLSHNEAQIHQYIKDYSDDAIELAAGSFFKEWLRSGASHGWASSFKLFLDAIWSRSPGRLQILQYQFDPIPRQFISDFVEKEQVNAVLYQCFNDLVGDKGIDQGALVEGMILREIQVLKDGGPLSIRFDQSIFNYLLDRQFGRNTELFEEIMTSSKKDCFQSCVFEYLKRVQGAINNAYLTTLLSIIRTDEYLTIVKKVSDDRLTPILKLLSPNGFLSIHLNKEINLRSYRGLLDEENEREIKIIKGLKVNNDFDPPRSFSQALFWFLHQGPLLGIPRRYLLRIQKKYLGLDIDEVMKHGAAMDLIVFQCYVERMTKKRQDAESYTEILRELSEVQPGLKNLIPLFQKTEVERGELMRFLYHLVFFAFVFPLPSLFIEPLVKSDDGLYRDDFHLHFFGSLSACYFALSPAFFYYYNGRKAVPLDLVSKADSYTIERLLNMAEALGVIMLHDKYVKSSFYNHLGLLLAYSRVRSCAGSGAPFITRVYPCVDSGANFLLRLASLVSIVSLCLYSGLSALIFDRIPFERSYFKGAIQFFALSRILADFLVLYRMKGFSSCFQGYYLKVMMQRLNEIRQELKQVNLSSKPGGSDREKQQLDNEESMSTSLRNR